MNVHRATMLFGLAASLILMSACGKSAPPTGQRNMRLRSTDVTEAELRSNEATNETLVLFAESAADQMVRDLSDRTIYGISDSDHLVTIILGTIENKTLGRMPTQDFEMVVRRMQTRLLTSDVAKQNLRFQRRRASVERNTERERGTTADGMRMSDPEYTFFLDGFMHTRQNDTPVRYYLNFILVKEIDGEIVWSTEYEENRQ